MILQSLQDRPMPFPASSVERKLLHTRSIKIEGFERADGLFDIEGWMTDVKAYSFPNRERGEIKAGEPLHGMGVRITLDESMTIQDAVAVTDFSPFRVCPDITPNFKRLIGLKIKAGLNNAVKERLGGVQGCTHLVELMGPIATTAFQTMVAKRFAKMSTEAKQDTSRPPALIDTCHAWSAEGELVGRDYPKFAKKA
jgi:hypothetical protein